MKLEPVAMDAEGMVPESLEHCCRMNAIKGIYLMPNMQNPTATVMSAERKQAIAAIILRYGLILIEDDIYHDTNLTDQTALSTLVPDHGIFICGISKAFYPGLRIAYTLVPERFLHAFTQMVANTVWMAPTLSAELVTRIIETGRAADILKKKRQVLAARVKLAKDILHGFSYQITDNSVFVWLTLPEGWTCADFESTALIHKIRVISASKFYVGSQQPPNAVRVSLCSVRDEAELIKGLEGLVRIMKQNPLLTTPVM
jgi:DNA-binding transcriptional MocR family regulator